MSQKKRDKLYTQKRIQDLYRKIKQERRENIDYMNDYSDMDDSEDNKIGRSIVRVCAVLGILFVVLEKFIEF
ncbi:hypothetical protein M3649_06570 [Ureibacillus chungkukjangi]|uniref:hypothetical protein n=1 Tax=Ureibacillus chungkukjangi TaxID=1202712 RepID=UPI00203B71E3|nr:hypothetical protein [Ureibacillus chungkukjangi]MCM3387795.1 hypothetical protein [Ureibacillus chungkukjangi]